MKDYEIIEEASFRFSPRFSQLIGRNLISNPIVAVSELVKNSYDADANKIEVIFNNLTNSESMLTILDDGTGMSLTDLKNKWLVVGTDNKVTDRFTETGRRKLGEKGIGRFSVERLARQVLLKTKRENDTYELELAINWDDYENANGEFSDVKHQIRKLPSEKGKKGTSLALVGLRDIWNEDTLINLRKELNLIRPIDLNKVSFKTYSFPGDNVNIQLKALDFGVNYKALDLGFIEFYQAHLFGEIYKDGSALIRVVIRPSVSISKELMEESISYDPKSKEIDTSCGPLSFEVFAFMRDKRLYRSLDIDRDKLTNLLDNYCGVKIYRDGFRILPFGDEEDDWLELNASRASSPEHRLGTGNTIGVVNITRDDNPGLQDVLSRENMYDTVEFKALKKFINIAFEKYSKMQIKARKEADRSKEEKGKAVLTEAKKSVAALTKQVNFIQRKVVEFNDITDNKEKESRIASLNKNLTQLLSTAESSLDIVKNAYTFYKMQDSFKSREMQIYRNIATLGISAAMFGHEALNQTTDAKAICLDIKDDFEEILYHNKELSDQVSLLLKDIELIDEKADFFRNYLRKDKQDRAKLINIRKILYDILGQHKKAFKSINVQPQIQCELIDEELLTWGYEGDFATLFSNLITNAYKALRQPTDNKYLVFKYFKDSSNFTILVENNGAVIELEDRSRIFEPLFSTYSEGTGLGLTIIQDTLITYKGTIDLCDKYPETLFKIVIPIQMSPGGN
ncbi:ATP-binding protein [Lacrimispora sp.]|uniref:ATP-binding protein n=1 Tax=Lacrimispora sp. TaxID=2719234 RepID=UPI0039932BF1